MEPPSASEEAVTTPDLLTAAASDRCASCNSPLAPDQQYCVNCGERRGKPRFSYQPQAPAAPASTAPARERGRGRTPAGLTLVAGVATLLLAMGVGVLIGQNSTDNSKTVAAQTPVITVNGSGTGTGAGANTTASTSSGSKKSGKGATKAAKTTHLTKKVVTQVNNAAANVVGTQAHLAPATVGVGSKCTSGQAGCQNGKFTGNFFP